MTPSSVYVQLWVNEKDLTAVFENGLTEFQPAKSYFHFNDELRSLWISVYNDHQRDIKAKLLLHVALYSCYS